MLRKDIKQVWRWESGKGDPSADALVDLAKVLNVSTDYLLGVSDNPAPNNEPGQLSLQEWEIVTALRRGDLKTAMRVMSEQAKTCLFGSSQSY